MRRRLSFLAATPIDQTAGQCVGDPDYEGEPQGPQDGSDDAMVGNPDRAGCARQPIADMIDCVVRTELQHQQTGPKQDQSKQSEASRNRHTLILLPACRQRIWAAEQIW